MAEIHPGLIHLMGCPYQKESKDRLSTSIGEGFFEDQILTIDTRPCTGCNIDRRMFIELGG